MPAKRTVEGEAEPKPKPSLADALRAQPPIAEVDPLDPRAPLQIAIDEVKRILGPGVAVAFVNRPEDNQGRMSELSRWRYEPLRLEDPRLTDSQRRELRGHLRVRPEGWMIYQDLVVLITTEEQAKKRQQYNEEQRLRREHSMRQTESAEAQSRELGIAVEDKW